MHLALSEIENLPVRITFTPQLTFEQIPTARLLVTGLSEKPVG
jgi:hypothetical protein